MLYSNENILFYLNQHPTVCVLGGGKTGKSTYDFLKSLHLNPFLVDRNPVNGYNTFSDSNLLSSLPDFQILIKSPGISPNHPLLIESRKQKKSIFSEIDLASAFFRGKIISITGTDGKSTTTALTSHLIQKAYPKTKMGGNIGTPFLDFCREDLDFAVLELSSYQLEDSSTIPSIASCILNLANDHLERHGTLENYRNAKLKIINHQNPDHVFITSSGFMKSLKDHEIRSKTLIFGIEEGPDAKINFKEKTIQTPKHIYSYEKFQPEGNHNLLNLCASLLLAEVADCDPGILETAIETFSGLKHRFQTFANYKSTKFINDSKSTNSHSLVAGVKGLSTDIAYFLILGGRPKEEPLDQLFLALRENPPKKILLFGEASEIWGNEFEKEFPERLLKIRYLKDSFDCIESQWKSEAYDRILFSPGGSSFDEFSNFEERGDFYMENILKRLNPGE
ncbi:MAG: UDP-N-acetylmuramoyl-L-alanine--D-glutamate ligase [Leptospiraceae bacterium]|nr:UDP-N-acetylmuramoyl-L-alanine--D-glutamate ligase [Leptospiraceae bacterium]